jgi:hypothetical protein
MKEEMLFLVIFSFFKTEKVRNTTTLPLYLTFKFDLNNVENKFCFKSSVVDPDPHCIRIQRLCGS